MNVEALHVPGHPTLAVQCIPGLGKSHEFRSAAAQTIRRFRASGDNNGTVVIFVPTHQLAAEQVEKFKVEHPDIRAKRFLGISREDPHYPGRQMCHRAGVVADLCEDGVALRDLCANPGKGIYCPHHVEVSDAPCGYSVQAQQKADVWILPHQKLFAPAPDCVGEPRLVAIDESFWQASLQGFDVPYRLSLQTLALARDTQNSLGREQSLQPKSELVYRAIVAQGDGFVDCGMVKEALGEQAEQECADAYRLYLDHPGRLEIRPDMGHEALQEVLGRLKSSAVMRQARFWDSLRLGIERGGVTPFIEKRTEETKEGVTTWLYLYGRKEIHPDWAEPTVILDAALPEQITRTFYPTAQIQRFECPMPHARVVQVRDKTLSKAMMLPTEQTGKRKRTERQNNVKRMLSLCRVLVSRYPRRIEVGGKPIAVLLITYKALEQQLVEAGLPEGVATLHYGATSGLDTYGQVPCIVTAGRLEVPLREAEHIASVLKGHMLERVSDVEGAWYPKTLSAIETRDSLIEVPTTRHPESLVEEVRWSVNEGQLIQAIGRGRGVRRTPDNPLDLFVLTNVPLPLVVDEVLRWDEIVPTAVEEVLAEHGVAPLSYGEMVRTMPDVWSTKRVARYAVQKFQQRYPEAATASPESGCQNAYKYVSIGERARRLVRAAPASQKRLFDTLVLVEYTREAKGAKPCRAVIRNGHGEANGQAALERLVGPLRRYRVLRAIHSGELLPAPLG